MGQMVSTNYRTFTGEVLLGYCGVDSGQLMITDPCYASDWLDEMRTEGGEFDGSLKPFADGSYPYSYNGACSATLSDKRGGQLGNFGTGVAVSTGGDGSFPVIATFRSGRIESIRIDFIDNSVEDEITDEEDAEAEERWQAQFGNYDPNDSARFDSLHYEDQLDIIRGGLDRWWEHREEEDNDNNKEDK